MSIAQNINKDSDSELFKTRKIYGVYPGSLVNPEAVRELSEADLFITIYTIDRFLYARRFGTKFDGKVEDVSEDFYALQFCMAQTIKFGVELCSPHTGAYRKTESYLDWEEFWKNNFGNNVMDCVIAEYHYAKANNQSVSKFLPKCSWKESKLKEAKSLKLQSKC